jgi:hypothetical protein
MFNKLPDDQPVVMLTYEFLFVREALHRFAGKRG